MNSTILFAQSHYISKFTFKFVGNYSIAFSLVLKNKYKNLKIYIALTLEKINAMCGPKLATREPVSAI